MSGIMSGKAGIVMGVANDKSIAYGIARTLVSQGAAVGLSYQGEALAARMDKIAPTLNDAWHAPCDVSDPEAVATFFAEVKKQFGHIDFLVHAIAYSDKDELRGAYLDTSRANFLNTMDVSCYSLLEVTRAAKTLFNPGAAVVTLSYFGAEKMIPNYNVMGVAKAALEASVRYMASDLGKQGVRINALSAGPMRTLAASGIDQFKDLLRWQEMNAPLRRNVTLDDVGGAGLYLCSSLSGAVTGEVHHVDSGSHCMGMRQVDDRDEADRIYQRFMQER